MALTADAIERTKAYKNDPVLMQKQVNTLGRQLQEVERVYKENITDKLIFGGALPLWTSTKVMLRGTWIGTHWNYEIKDKLEAEMKRLRQEIAILQEDIKLLKLKPKGRDLLSRQAGPTTGPTVLALPGDVVYNIPPVKSALFNPNAFKDWSPSYFAQNTPSAVKKASELWSNGRGSKGMFVTWVPKEGVYLPATDGTAGKKKTTTTTLQGFQFHYNPTTISMGYDNFGLDTFDPSLYLQGGQMPTRSLDPLGTISIEILINRIGDMSLWTEKGAPVDGTSEAFGSGPRSAYPRAVRLLEARKVWEQGTMYDIRQLIKVANGGAEYESLFRGLTSDMGLLLNVPMEVRLGKDLNYLARVTSMSINHTMFDSRMVPIFSRVSISLGRLPDYKEIASDYSLDGEGNVIPVTTTTTTTTTSSRTGSPAIGRNLGRQ
jgi:hypothetical protein